MVVIAVVCALVVVFVVVKSVFVQATNVESRITPLIAKGINFFIIFPLIKISHEFLTFQQPTYSFTLYLLFRLESFGILYRKAVAAFVVFMPRVASDPDEFHFVDI